MREIFIRQLRSWLFPVRCPVCRCFIFPEEDFCSDCADKLVPYSKNLNIPGASGSVAAFEYTDSISPAILMMKKGVIGNSAYALGKALALRIRNSGMDKDIDLIVTVPMFSPDIRKRGCDQVHFIARKVGKELGIKVSGNCLIKTRKTKQQKSLTADERMVNIQNAFKVADPELVNGKNILLIDDVCTTGSTFTEITKLLLKNGAAKVYCASCCRTVITKEGR